MIKGKNSIYKCDMYKREKVIGELNFQSEGLFKQKLRSYWKKIRIRPLEAFTNN